jgi:hypothetical protein
MLAIPALPAQMPYLAYSLSTVGNAANRGLMLPPCALRKLLEIEQRGPGCGDDRLSWGAPRGKDGRIRLARSRVLLCTSDRLRNVDIQ